MSDPASKPLRAAVVGAGYLGSFHAEKYAQAAGCELVAVADIDRGRAEALAARLGTRAVADFRELLGAIDCASVVVPTQHHHSVASVLLGAGIDCLVEKPLAASAALARDLVALGRRAGPDPAGRTPRALQPRADAPRAHAHASRASSSATAWRRSPSAAPTSTWCAT